MVQSDSGQRSQAVRIATPDVPMVSLIPDTDFERSGDISGQGGLQKNIAGDLI